MIKTHHICITIDCDPDELSGKEVNRESLKWMGLESMDMFPERISEFFKKLIPLTWFIRFDGQIDKAYGSYTYLFTQYYNLWEKCLKLDHEFGCHPHLYKYSGKKVELMSDENEIHCELIRINESLKETGYSFKIFRNGEGWMKPAIINQLEESGYKIDSTALPGLYRTDNHPMNWQTTPNYPYYPSLTDIGVPGNKRNIIEFPMNTWSVKAPYDKTNRLRYMNPAIKKELFQPAVSLWQDQIIASESIEFYWIFITHPNEIIHKTDKDLLYAFDEKILFNNIKYFIDTIEVLGHTYTFNTLTEAMHIWKQSN